MNTYCAYIPSFNSAETLSQAIGSIQRQTVSPSQFFVVDDCSTDRSVEVAKEMGVQVVCLSGHQGRGAVRARAMEEAQHELVLSLDSSKTVAPDFVERALNWFANSEVSAVFGPIVQGKPAGVLDRWCRRHLLKSDNSTTTIHKASLITAGAIVRRSAVMKVGNYSADYIYAEDRELGDRLLALGMNVVFDPNLSVALLGKNCLGQVLERYWRWHSRPDRPPDFGAYLRQFVYSFKVMAVEDLREGDPLSVPISLLSPHYQLFKSLTTKQT